eukprot:5624193-Pleurochrysis_carterae.AAC.1
MGIVDGSGVCGANGLRRVVHRPFAALLEDRPVARVPRALLTPFAALFRRVELTGVTHAAKRSIQEIIQLGLRIWRGSCNEGLAGRRGGV